MRRWIEFASLLVVDAIVMLAQSLHPTPVVRPRDERYDVWLSDGDGPLMHVGAMTAADAWRATVGR